MFDWLLIKVRRDANGWWCVKWRWDNRWMCAPSKNEAKRLLKENSY